MLDRSLNSSLTRFSHASCRSSCGSVGGYDGGSDIEEADPVHKISGSLEAVEERKEPEGDQATGDGREAGNSGYDGDSTMKEVDAGQENRGLDRRNRRRQVIDAGSSDEDDQEKDSNSSSGGRSIRSIWTNRSDEAHDQEKDNKEDGEGDEGSQDDDDADNGRRDLSHRRNNPHQEGTGDDEHSGDGMCVCMLR